MLPQHSLLIVLDSILSGLWRILRNKCGKLVSTGGVSPECPKERTQQPHDISFIRTILRLWDAEPKGIPEPELQRNSWSLLFLST